MNQGKVFRYKPNYVAAWLTAESEEMLLARGLQRRVHMTTFFDGYGQMASLDPFQWTGVRQARIAAVVDWQVRSQFHLVAEMADCEWSHAINYHYLAQGAREDKPHRPHVTLDKRVVEGTAANFQDLVGKVLRFDRHGWQVDDRPSFMVAGDLVLRDWKVELGSDGALQVTTPPMEHGIRKTFTAQKSSNSNDGLFLLASAMLSAPRSRGTAEGEDLVEKMAMSLLGKSKDPAPGVNWQCSRAWSVDEVRKAVRCALRKSGVIIS